MKDLLTISLLFGLFACNDTTTRAYTSSVDTASASPAIVPKVAIKGGSEMLYQHIWVVEEIKGETIDTQDSTRIPELAFTPGQINRVSGTTGCNRLNGTFEISTGNVLKFNPPVTTRMACVGTNVESSFLAALGEVDQFSAPDSVSLWLLKNGESVLKLVAK